MRSVLVLGSGRSGTSMVTGSLAQSGLAMGEGHHAPRSSNPKGFFETPAVNGLNEALLAGALRPRPTLARGQRWLGIPRADARFEATPELAERMRAALAARPFCHKDPRFSFTLPAWRPLLPEDTGLVCVFRDPRLTARSIVEEVRGASYLQGVEVDREHALALWEASYRAILRQREERGDWLFLHYDQVALGDGLERLARFVGAEVDRGFPDGAMRRPAPDEELPAALRELYDELCELAGHRADAVRVSAPRERVSVVSVVDAATPELVARLAADVRAQRGVDAELLVVESGGSDFRAARPTGPEERDGARVLRASGVGRGRALRDAADHVGTELVALLDPDCRPLPAWLARSVAALQEGEDARVATCDLFLSDEQGQYVDRMHPADMGEAPGPYWHGGLVLTRAALEQVDPRAYRRSELELYVRARREGRVAHVTEPGLQVPLARWRGAWDDSRRDAALLALDERPARAEGPALSVSICTFDRRETLAECLEAFCRQLVPAGTYELVITDDGSSDGTPELLERIEFPVPARVLRQENGGLSAARNAGLPECRGELVLFVNDDTIPLPDLVDQHLRAHRRAAQPVAVLGSFEQPPQALDNALIRYLESSSEIFGYGALDAGRAYGAMRFWTCNVSAPLAAVRAAGGFDESFRHYGCEDTDLGVRLAARGLRVLYHPQARAWHRHWIDFDYLARRQRTVARAYVRFYRKHPGQLGVWGRTEEITAEGCRAQLGAHAAARPQLEAAARELARIDVGALERLGPDYAPVVQDVLARLGELVHVLNRVWWWQGYEEGFAEHGLAGFPELWAGVPEDERATADAGAAPDPAGAGGPRPAPELSVVVPTRDRAECLVGLLDALARQDLEPERFEVLVVDDASRVPAAQVLSGRAVDFTLTVLRQEGGGPGRARNLGVARARGDVIAFFNDDAVPRPDALRRHLEAHRWSREQRAVQGAFPLQARRRLDSFARLVDATDLLFAWPRMKPGVLYDGAGLCTGNVSLPRAALEAVGGFDEDFPFAGGEDSELGLRLERVLGLRVLFDPRIVAEHDHELDVDQYARRQRVLGWSVAAIVEKHGDPSLATGSPDVPLDEAFFERTRAELAARAPSLEAAAAAVRRLCERERSAGGWDPTTAAKLEPLVRRVGEVEYRRGLLLAQAGVPAAELWSAVPASAGAAP